MLKKIRKAVCIGISIFLILSISCLSPQKENGLNDLKHHFAHPPDSARPGVYWYFMDGNISREGITRDLEAMDKAGIGHVIFLEVNVGIPRGKVDFMSDEWMDLFDFIVKEAERVGITVTLGTGPGWTGSGGPWIQGSESMKHLVSSSLDIQGPGRIRKKLPLPESKNPYFGLHQFPENLKKRWEEYYEDVKVLAFPSVKNPVFIKNIDEKALYYREPYTSKPGVKPFLAGKSQYQELPLNSVTDPATIRDVSGFLGEDGFFEWNVPPGKWTILRTGSRNNGAITRPAPLPGVGFEADKFDTTGILSHLDNFTEKLFRKTGIPDPTQEGGLKMLHMDSWEMGAQNWTANFMEEFSRRRGYDPLPWLPVYSGRIVGSLEQSERFLWDLRQTSMELIIEYHAGFLKEYAKKYNLGFSIEPYDMNPSADMELGSVADVPMCEFWTKDYGFISSWSVIQAASIAHINNNPVVAAESFTAHLDAWKMYPGNMKNQGDWAFAAGVNRIFYHTFQHQCLPNQLKPGMTMGPYGVHHDRNQTWWSMSDAYHKYITRCQFILQHGKPVAEILYLTPEGAPQVFRAPASALTHDNSNQQSLQLGKNESVSTALTEDEIMPDRKGYNFSGCSPGQLMKAEINNNKIVFPGGASFSLLVMPRSETISPELILKIEELINQGACVVGNPPVKAPGLENYPECDEEVKECARRIWGTLDTPKDINRVKTGKGSIISGKSLYPDIPGELYPEYSQVSAFLSDMGIKKDIEVIPDIRYTHKTLGKDHIYFLSNKSNLKLSTKAIFNVSNSAPELWNPVNGKIREIPSFTFQNNQTSIELIFEPWQSYFIVFPDKQHIRKPDSTLKNFPENKQVLKIAGSWDVYFNPQWGGPEHTVFSELTDWTHLKQPGIKYYSGTAVYHKHIRIDSKLLNKSENEYFLNTGEIYNIARVFVNGKDMGVIWTAPWEVNISKALTKGDNSIELHVANLWPNRLIGDEKMPDDGIKNGQWPDWLLKGEKRSSGRYTFSSYKHYSQEDPLLPSGLINPVYIMSKSK